MMNYGGWLTGHIYKHRQIVEKLKAKGFGKEQIIDYFRFENMALNEPAFCKLYKHKEQCHEMEGLNCYLCACPYFRFSDEGISEDEEERTLYSTCSINAKEGKPFATESAIHHDCSACQIPHKKSFIEKHYHEDLATIMAACEVEGMEE